MNSFADVLRNSIIEQFGARRIASGPHKEFPSLHRLWIAVESERAEQKTLEQACKDVVLGADKMAD